MTEPKVVRCLTCKRGFREGIYEKCPHCGVPIANAKVNKAPEKKAENKTQKKGIK